MNPSCAFRGHTSLLFVFNVLLISNNWRIRRKDLEAL
jgi:hypothetical protein